MTATVFNILLGIRPPERDLSVVQSGLTYVDTHFSSIKADPGSVTHISGLIGG